MHLDIPFCTASNYLKCINHCHHYNISTRRPASAERTVHRQFQAVFRVITSNFPTNVIAHSHGLSMDLTVGRTVGTTVDSTVG